MPQTPLAIETDRLGRTYRGRRRDRRGVPTVALDAIDLHVRRGELFGLLGPNGAGKTTLIKILTTLLAPTSGSARVAGFDVHRDAARVRPLINMVSGGEASGYGLLTVRENLWMFAQFYGISSADVNRRIRDLLARVHMSDRLETKSSELSTGLRQKMNIVRGFLTDPDVLFLDEPTLGLDVGAQREVRSLVRTWMDEDRSRTVLLTTHYMVEADELCDRVAIIDGGRVLACDTPSALKRRLGREPRFHLETGLVDVPALQAVQRLAGVRSLTCEARDGAAAVDLSLDEERVIGAVITTLEARGIGVLSLNKREPTLEDVFVDLVGRSMAELEAGHEPRA